MKLVSLEKQLESNPHLLNYLTDVKERTGNLPKYMDMVTRDDYEREPNVVYDVGNSVFIHIHFTDKGTKYYAIEPTLTKDEIEKKNRIQEIIFKKSQYVEREKVKANFEEVFDILFDESITYTENKKKSFGGLRKVPVTQDQYNAIKYYLKRDIFGVGIIEPLMLDPNIEDIHSIGTVNLSLVHKVYGTLETNIAFKDAKALDLYMRNISERIGKPVSLATPVIDATMPDNSRINIIYADDVSVKGPSFTIRKFTPVPLSISQIVKWGTLSAELAAYLWLCLENGMSIFVVGETASGKTSTVNGMLPFIPHDKKIYSVEDTREVQPPHEIWQQLLTRETGSKSNVVDSFDLLKAALRSRPNYIIVGEIRGPEGAIAFQAMQTGHPVISTFHAGSIQKMIQRLAGDPINVPLRFIDNLNICVVQASIYSKGRQLRRIISVGEVIGYSKETQGIMTKDVFRWNAGDDSHRFRGMYNSYILEEKIAKFLGYPNKKHIYEDLDIRTRIIEALVDNEIFDYHEVKDSINQFQLSGVEGLSFGI